MAAATAKHWSMSTFLVISVTLLVFCIVGLLFFKTIPNAIENVLFTVIGAILAKWQTIVDYHFGSSSGSQRKTDMLNDLTDTTDGTVETHSRVTTQKVTTVSTLTPTAIPVTSPPESE